jgi:hypothetical protein
MIYTSPVETNMEVQLPIHPQHIGNLDQIIYRDILETLPTCRKDYGYIMNVLEIIKNSDFLVSHSNGYILVDVRVRMNTVLPCSGDLFKCYITGLYNEGIFAKYNKMTIFCPGIYSETEYKVGDWIDIEITAVQYIYKNYQCIGKLI